MNVKKSCDICYNEVTEMCQDKKHSAICRLMNLPFDEKIKTMYEGMFSLLGSVCINIILKC